MIEFTGERVIPGQVDPDLWNEHISRYAFASRLSRNKRVLELGCGTGYGSAEIARTARGVTALDICPDAVQYAQAHFPAPNLHFIAASCAAIPVKTGSVDLVVAFEVIEHLEQWIDLLAEARRVLAPGGQFIVSTPNKLYYAESRRLSGPNPYHHHEFEFAEFQAELGNYFPHVRLFLQNHAEGIVLTPVEPASSAEVRMGTTAAKPEESHFFIAVCALAPQTGTPTFVYLPGGGNVLRERERHIQALERELATKDEWLRQAKLEHTQLLELFDNQQQALANSNQWAEALKSQLETAAARINQLQQEYDAAVAAYESKIRALETELEERTHWAIQTETRLQQQLEQKCDELANCVDILHRTEKELEERTEWALKLNADAEFRQEQLNMVKSSRWIKLGRLFGVGPGLRD